MQHHSRLMWRARHFVLIAAGLLVSATSNVLRAQAAPAHVTGTVLRPDSATVATGTLVELQAGVGVLQRTLTDSRGRFRFVVPSGDSVRVRALRPGMRPASVSLFLLTAGETRDLVVVLRADPVSLSTVRVRDSRVCGERAEAPAWRRWEQARTAVQNASLAESDSALEIQLIEFEGETTASGTTLVVDSLIRATGSYRPHTSAYYDSLFRHGFIWAATSGATYHGPDARFLSDERFAATHCFRTVERRAEHAGAIGVRFEPIRKPKHTGIEGTFWIDSVTAMPVSLEFSYVNPPRGHTADGTGGYARFTQLETGHWMLGDWMVRMARDQRRFGVPVRHTDANGNYTRNRDGQFEDVYRVYDESVLWARGARVLSVRYDGRTIHSDEAAVDLLSRARKGAPVKR